MLFIPCFLSYLILHFRTYHCLGSKETTTWTTYAYSYCSVLCRESCGKVAAPVFIPCFLSYLILHFRTYHCLGSKETTTWTTYAYSYCSVQCRESCRPCRWAVRLRGSVGPGFHGKYFADTNLSDFIDLYSVSVIAVKCAISCYMGLRYT